jgi:hypothetical protein
LPGADSYKEVDVHSRLLIIGAVALFSGSPVPVFDSCPTDDFEIDPWPDKKGWRFEYVAKPATAYRYVQITNKAGFEAKVGLVYLQYGRKCPPPLTWEAKARGDTLPSCTGGMAVKQGRSGWITKLKAGERMKYNMYGVMGDSSDVRIDVETVIPKWIAPEMRGPGEGSGCSDKPLRFTRTATGTVNYEIIGVPATITIRRE